jgi:hypothetical protein
MIYPTNSLFAGAGWCCKTGTVTPAWKGRRVMGHFKAVNHAARVWPGG